MHKAQDYFIFRTPLLPNEDLTGLADGLTAIHAVADSAKLGAAITADVATVRARLHAFIERPEVHEALLLASSELINGIEHWTKNPDSKQGAKMERSLFRYVTRMCSRCTPFGLFAGCAVGTLSDRTDLVLAERGTNHRVTRIDNELLTGICTTLAADAITRRGLRLFPNTSWLAGAGWIRYHESRLVKNHRAYFLAAVDDSRALRVALARAKGGATLIEIAAAIVEDDPELQLDDAEAFVDALIVNQLLVHELDLPVTGETPVDVIAERLAQFPSTAAISRTLTQVSTQLRELDQVDSGVHPDRYKEITATLTALAPKVPANHFFQVDLIKRTPSAVIGQAVIDELEKAIDALRVMYLGSNDALRDFREAFDRRYEQQQVPLLEVLDEEMGIGLGVGWLEKQQLSVPWTPWGPMYDLLHDRLMRCAEERSNEIVLTDADMARITAKQRNGTKVPLPDMMDCMCALVASSADAVNQGDYQILLNGAFTAVSFSGRFCHADPDLHKRVRQTLRAEEALRPDVVFAEIVHLPQGRIGNVICRPVLRDYEIPYLGLSGAPHDRQISLDDLLVSVRNGHVVLHSRRLGREVAPRLTTAHNHSHAGNLPVYRFLCDIQKQHVATGLSFSWGALGSYRYLPRVRYGRVILSGAQWRLDKEQLSRLRGTRAQSFAAVQALRAQLKLPRFIQYLDYGNEPFLVDLDQPLSVDCLVDDVDGKDSAMIRESIQPDQLCAHGPEGRFYHELIVPLVRKAKIADEKPSAVVPEKIVLPPTHVTAQRSFIPGSTWLYLKLYSGRGFADSFLSTMLPDILRPHFASGAVQRWFFIRYSDPQQHIRLRLYGDPQRLANEVQPAIHNHLVPLWESGWFWRIMYDTYQRETERYGGPEGIDLAEQLFHIDSEAILALIAQYPGEAASDVRQRLALRSCDSLMTAAELTLPQRRTVLRRALGLPPVGDGRTTHVHQFNDVYRAQRLTNMAALNPLDTVPEELKSGAKIIAERDARLVPILAELRQREKDKRLTSTVSELLNSFHHMSINRLLRQGAHGFEPMIYDSLDRIYHATLARSKEKVAEPTP